jgi:intraflagellar transport protein 80
MVESFCWNQEQDLLAVIADGKYIVWYYPNVLFVDEDIIELTKFVKDARYLYQGFV